jgi:DNA-binding LacI/PurR family transcriptional regulator
MGNSKRKPSYLVNQVMTYLKREIKTLEHGNSLPTEFELCDKFNVSRKTVRVAMSQLEEQGLIMRIQGKGTFPTSGKSAHPVFRSKVCRFGMVPVPSRGSSDFYSAILDGAMKEAREIETQIVLTPSKGKQSTSEECFRLLDDDDIAGLILISITDQDLLAEIASRKKPVVLVDHFIEKGEMDCIRVNSSAGSRIGVEHLVKIGHTKIAFFNNKPPEVNKARFEGYKQGLQDNEIEFRDEYVFEVSPSVDGGIEGANSLLSLPQSERPTAVIAFAEVMALGAIQAFMKFGLEVPEDVSVIGTGGIEPVVAVGMPELTAIRFNSADLGRFAVRALNKRVNNLAKEYETVMISPNLKLGQSTSPAKTGSAK